MRVFEYIRVDSVDAAVGMVGSDPGAQYLAGGTTQIDLMLKDGVIEASRLVDITRLPLRGITRQGDSVVVGALTTMEELAAHLLVRERLPFIRDALLAGASPQLRNMATIGGNLLQRTRCRYFRDPAVPACNKRLPGTGCAAISGVARMHAILGASDHCIALHASDLCVPLTALDALVRTQGTGGERSVPLTEFFMLPSDRPDVENVLTHGELITAVEIPLLPASSRSTYLKVRDRSSYEFALTSAAVSLVLDHGRISQPRIALGGVGTVPWRARGAEQVLTGGTPSRHLFREAAEASIINPFTVPGTAFKVELAKRTIVRALEEAST